MNCTMYHHNASKSRFFFFFLSFNNYSFRSFFFYFILLSFFMLCSYRERTFLGQPKQISKLHASFVGMMKMESDFWWMIFTALISVFVATWWLLKRANQWFSVSSMLTEKQHALPPGDIGWPLIGNTWSFLISFKYGSPDSFISSFVTRSPLFPSLIFHELT